MLGKRLKRVVIVGCLVACGGLVVACGSGSEGSTSNSDATKSSSGAASASVKVNFVCGTTGAGVFYAPLVKGAEDAAKEANVDLTYTGLGSDTSPAAMTKLLQAAINQKPEALIVCDYFPEALNPLIKEAIAQGIPVVNSNGGYEGAAEAGVVAQVGQDDRTAGRGAGEEMIKAGVKKPVCVNHSPGNPSTVARCEGFEDAYKAEGLSVKIVNLPPAQLANTAAQQASIKGILSADQSIDGVLMLGPEGATAAVGAVDQVGRADSVKVGTFDTSEDILANIESGKLLFAVWQQPYLQGYLPVQIAATYVRHYGLAPKGILDTGPAFINKENIARVKAAAKAGVA